MQLDDILGEVDRHLVAVAALGDERTREVATSLAAAAGPAVRLAVLRAVTLAAEETTAALLDQPGAPTVTVALDDDRVRVEVRPTAPPAAPPPPVAVEADETDATARISLRLPEQLKARVDTAALHEGMSVNAWVVATLSQALGVGRGGARGPSFGAIGGAHHVSGWIHG
ncbi:MAG: toxin-antitoxin system HicB family antitoxin [Jatrophihabitans sp.]|uniref:toxin-antitoxin system HicB family antitoxin n=1 Tax=Jatrophihabitans sp. TaxID=1932789 RepID=UPI003F7FF9AC